eukprot:12670800-Prorocentrum_lima.AAC.1
MDKPNSPFKAVVLDHNLPKVSIEGMDYILGFLSSLVDLRKITADTQSSKDAVAGLEQRLRNANLHDAYGEC